MKMNHTTMSGKRPNLMTSSAGDVMTMMLVAMTMLMTDMTCQLRSCDEKNMLDEWWWRSWWEQAG